MENGEKQTGDYKINWQSYPEPGNKDRNALKVTISPALQELLKSASVAGDLESCSYNDGEEFIYLNRPKVRRFVIGALRSAEQVIFSQELLTNGEMVFYFYSLNARDEFITRLKGSLREVIRIISQENINETTNFQIVQE